MTVEREPHTYTIDHPNTPETATWSEWWQTGPTNERHPMTETWATWMTLTTVIIPLATIAAIITTQNRRRP